MLLNQKNSPDNASPRTRYSHKDKLKAIFIK